MAQAIRARTIAALRAELDRRDLCPARRSTLKDRLARFLAQ